MKVWDSGMGAGGWLVGIGYRGFAILNPFFGGLMVTGKLVFWGCSWGD